MRTSLASVILVAAVSAVAGCGDDGGVRHLDANSMIDSPITMIDAPNTVQPVTLTVSLNGTPQEGVKVYFLAADSSVISNTVTDATGVASAIMPAGGSVTAIDPYKPPAGLPGTYYQLYTFAGVKPGDHLKLAEPGETANTNVDVTMPLDTTQTVAAYYVGTPCNHTSVDAAQGSGSTIVANLSLSPDCGTTTTDFLVMALDANGQPVHYFFMPNTTIASTLDFSAQTYATPTAKTYTVTNAATFLSEYSIQQIFAGPHGPIVTTGGPQDTNLFSTGQDMFSYQFPSFANALDLVAVFGSKGGYGQQLLVNWGPFPTSHAYTTDLAARALPDVSGLPTVDIAGRQVTWTQDVTGVQPDTTVMTFTASRSTNTAYTQWTWQVAAPHTAGAVSLPTLPTDVFDFNLATNDVANLDELFFWKVPGGYDALRADIFIANGNPLGPITTATGELAIEFVQTTAPQIVRKAPASTHRPLFLQPPTRR